jgi:hypothetical protein
MAFKKPRKPKIKMSKSKSPKVVLRHLEKQRDKVKDYEAKVKEHEATVKKIEKAKDDISKLKNKLSK